MVSVECSTGFVGQGRHKGSGLKGVDNWQFTMENRTCWANMASNLASVIPGRSRQRRRCTSAGAVTTSTASTELSRPFSNSSGISRTTIWCPSSWLCRRPVCATSQTKSKAGQDNGRNALIHQSGVNNTIQPREASKDEM
jgi:hypothetical protein